MTKKSAKDAEATFLDKRNVFMDLITPSSCIIHTQTSQAKNSTFRNFLHIHQTDMKKTKQKRVINTKQTLRENRL